MPLGGTSLWIGPDESSGHPKRALLKERGPPGEEPMMSRSLIRRLERLETRLGVRIRRIRVEFWDRSPDGTLIRRPHSDDDRTEGEYTIQVVFVSAALVQGKT